MKALYSFLVLSFAFVTFATAQEPSTIEESIEVEMGGPVMTLETTEVDYGTVEQNSDRIRTLRFTNTGDEPLVITKAKGSCGCTVPTPPKDPIAPGESSEITISYDTKRVGPINKRVTIYTNEASSPHVVRVIGKIKKKEVEPSAPEAEPTVIDGGDGQ